MEVGHKIVEGPFLDVRHKLEEAFEEGDSSSFHPQCTLVVTRRLCARPSSTLRKFKVITRLTKNKIAIPATRACVPRRTSYSRDMNS